MTSIYRETGRPGWVGATVIHGKRRKVYGRLKADVADKLRNLEAGVTAPSATTVAETLTTFLERDVATRDRAPATQETYRWSSDIIVARMP